MSETRATRTSSKRAVPPSSLQPAPQFPPRPSARHPERSRGIPGKLPSSWRIGIPRLALGMTVLCRGVARFVAQILNDEAQSHIQVQLLEHLLSAHRILDESRSHQVGQHRQISHVGDVSIDFCR